MTRTDIPSNVGDPLAVPPASSGSYPVRRANLVRPLVDGVAAFRRIGEAIERAQHGIWLTVAFYAEDFSFPDGRGGLFDVLERATSRGLDVRVLFWRPNAESRGHGRAFAGTATERTLLRARGSKFSIRWDRAHAGFVQHQKSWLIDAGQPSEIAFVGGINLTAKAVGSPGHSDGGRHDLYVEVTGPSATDVHHNFVQRWNEASERNQEDGTWGPGGAASLAFPVELSPPRGTSIAQIQRMIGAGRYTDGSATPGGRPNDITAGERSVLEQYERAIEAARSAIYIENQALPLPAIARRLEAALKRGVEVILVVPAEPEAHVPAARSIPASAELFGCIEALGCHETFMLAGLYQPDGPKHRAIYVHAKIMLVDDNWATIGSCNLHYNSLNGSSEMNVSMWDADVVRALRCELLKEHLGEDTSGLESSAALRLFRKIAAHNRQAMVERKMRAKGLAVALLPSEYAR
jgi:cardiolipin synthase